MKGEVLVLSALIKLERPMKYAILGFFAGIVGAFITHLLSDDSSSSYWAGPIGGLIQDKRQQS